MSTTETARRLSGSDGRYEYAYKGQTFTVARIGTSQWVVVTDWPLGFTSAPSLVHVLRLAQRYIDNGGTVS